MTTHPLDELTAAQAADTVRNISQDLRHLVGGQLIEGSVPGEVRAPWDRELGIDYLLADSGTVAAAIQAAATAFRAGIGPMHERRQVLSAMAAEVRAHQDELALLIAFETGKLLPSATMEAAASASSLTYWSGVEVPTEVTEDGAGGTTSLVRRPLGVVAAITPFNMPVLMMVNKIGAALITGNSIVCKPSPATPLSALHFARVISNAVPPGWVNVVAGEDSAGPILSESPDVAMVSFTGSIAVGKQIMRAAASTLKRVQLELGGNDPAIVGPDADLDVVVPQIFRGAFGSSGQACVAIKRVYAHESIVDDVARRLVVLAEATRVGNPFDPGTTAPALTTEAQFDRVQDLLMSARKAGADIAYEGKRSKSPGLFMQPSIVTGISNGTPLVDEEQFGPVLPVVPYGSVDEVIRLANDGPHGLGATLWSNDEEFLALVTQGLHTGMVWVNGLGRPNPSIPFGGAKESGLGREGGLAGIDAFCELVAITRYGAQPAGPPDVKTGLVAS